MRLIDADELIEKVWRERLDSRERIAKMVENMPTVERTSKVTPLETGLHTLWGICECGRQVEKPGKNAQRGAYFCPRCGVRLEWE